jgi:tetratricopeptide (TPR) repeat protein
VNDLKEVQHRIDDASQRASRGNEEKALVIYKDVLVILEKELTRISEQIKVLSTKQPKFEKSKLYIMLHKEWAENALIVADIMSRMATIYERQEKYEAAQCCVEEARAIYQRHATFDEQHNKNGSSSREKEMFMELMMDQIEEATESHCLRQSLHETIERIREKIAATADETSRGFLYEDIFDKLSTVLSLELMYLGDNHPQIANSKGLFGKFYGEINQNEKALKAMNDAILICEKALGELHPQTGSKYQDAARLYDRIGGEENYSKAIDLYEKAISNFEKSEGNVSEKLCSSLNKVAILYIERKSYDIAIKKLKSAIHISEENYRERSDDVSTEPIQLWLNLGECHTLKGKSSLATEASRNALHIQRAKRKVYDLLPSKRSETIPGLISNSKITFTLKKLGQSLAVESKFEESYGYFMEALTILRGDLKTAQESGLFDPTVDVPGHEDNVASALYDIAKAKQSDAKYDEASEFYKESLELRKQSDKKRAVIERSNNINCAICLAGIGSIELVQNNDSDAFKSFNQAIYYARQEGIPDSDPVARMLWEKSPWLQTR